MIQKKVNDIMFFTSHDVIFLIKVVNSIFSTGIFSVFFINF